MEEIFIEEGLCTMIFSKILQVLFFLLFFSDRFSCSWGWIADIQEGFLQSQWLGLTEALDPESFLKFSFEDPVIRVPNLPVRIHHMSESEGL